MSRIYLPAWTSLLAVGFLLGHHYEHIIDWLADLLDADPHTAVAPARSNVRYLHRPYDWSQESETA